MAAEAGERHLKAQEETPETLGEVMTCSQGPPMDRGTGTRWPGPGVTSQAAGIVWGAPGVVLLGSNLNYSNLVLHISL